MHNLASGRGASLVVLITAAVAFAACTTSPPSALSQSGGELRVGLIADIVTLDPAGQFFSPANLTVANAVYDQLLVAREGQNVPSLAESLTPSSDLQTYTLVLRPEVKFSDGELLDAAAVVANFKRLLDPATKCACAPLVAGISTVEPAGPLSVTFRLKAPNVGFSTVLAKEPGYMVSPKALAAPGQIANKPVGTGPFILKEWLKGDHITLTRNPNYWRSGQPRLDAITYRVLPDAEARFQSLQAGSLDVVQTDSADHIVQARKNQNLAVNLASFNGSTAMTLNVAKSPFDDVRVRKAIAHAIDRTALVNVVDKGISEPSDGPFAKTSPFYADPGYPAFDPGIARQLVQEVGKPIVFSYKVTPSGVGPRRAAVLQQMLKDVGITMNIEPKEFTAILAAVNAKDFQAAELPTPDFTDPDIQLTRRFQTGSAQNWGGYSSRMVDDALVRGRTSADKAERAKAYADLARTLATDLPYIWLTRNYYGVISKAGVTGWQPLDAANLGVFRPEQLHLAR
jgi:ABC-type transport system substrate-binding protein